MMVGMDNANLLLTFYIAAWALGAIISLLVAYWVIRLAVAHGLRSHHYWLQKK